MKKLLSIILAVFMLMTVSACGTGDGTGNSGNGGNQGGGDNGGSEKITITFVVDDATYDTKDVVDGVFTLPNDPTKTDLSFMGWFFDKDTWQNKLTISTEVTKSVTVYAYFKEVASLSLNFYVYNNLYETIAMDGVSAITLPEEPKIDGFRFDGWYLLNYSGTMTTNKLTENYFVENNSIQSKNVKAKMTQITKDNSASGAYELSKDGRYIYMGEYPTGYYKNASIKSGGPNADGYYEDYSGNRYVMVESATYNAGTQFAGAQRFFQDNETPIKDGESYYFRVEEIKWRILENDGDTALVMPTQVLFRHKYQDAENKEDNDGIDVRDYAKSDVRYYMNNVLINKIFTEKERAVILTSWVDNSKDTIGANGTSPWADTFDKLFLLSRADSKKLDKDATTFKYKMLPVSDYQRATGCPVCSTELSGGEVGYTYYWMRAMSTATSVSVGCIMPNGNPGQNNVYSAEYGVVPCFHIDL